MAAVAEGGSRAGRLAAGAALGPADTPPPPPARGHPESTNAHWIPCSITALGLGLLAQDQ